MPLLERLEFQTLLLYLLVMMGIGLYFARRVKGGLDFFAGGRAVPWWVSGISLYMGNFSAWLFTGGAGMIYRTTWYGIVYFLLTGAVGYYIGARLTAVPWRRSRVISPVEFTRARFGVTTQQVLGVVTAVAFVAAAGNQLRAIASVVESILGIPIAPAAVGIGAIVIAYTLIGGLWAVVVTDVVQFVVLLAVTLLVGPLAIGLVDGGIPAILASMDLTFPATGGEPDHDAHFLVAGLITVVFGVASGQGPRFYCVPDEASARKVGQLAAVLFLTTPVLFSLPSLVARTVWGGPEGLAAHIPGADPHERVFLEIAKEVLPPGLVGVFLAAMFAATMSALDTVYNYVASIMSRDMYMHFKPETTDRGQLVVGRVMTLLIGTVTIGLSLLYMHGTGDLFKVMTDVFFLTVPVMSVPVALGLLYRRAPRWAALACMTAGIAAALVTKFVLGWPTGFHVYLTQGACIGVFLLSPWAAGKLGLIEDRTGVDRFYRKLDTPVDVATEVTGSREAALEIFKLVGGVTWAITVLVLGMMALELASPPATGAEPGKYVALGAILAVLGAFFFAAGRRSSRA